MKVAVIAMALLGGVISPAHADQPHRSRHADEVYRSCMSQYPGGWRSEREWSDECLEIAYPHVPARRALRDYYRRNGAQVEQERRRCVEDPHELNTSKCLHDAEQGRRW